MVFNEDSPNVLKLYDAITNSRYKKTGSSKEVAMQPVHDDEIADFRAALENLAVNIGRVFKHQRKESSEGKMNANGMVNKLIQYLKV
jgi:hypothetical protein